MRESEVVPNIVQRPKADKRQMKLRIPRSSGLAHLILGPVGRLVIIVLAVCVILGLGTFTFFYAKYSRLTDEKLGAGVFANTAKLFAEPDHQGGVRGYPRKAQGAGRFHTEPAARAHVLAGSG